MKKLVYILLITTIWAGKTNGTVEATLAAAARSKVFDRTTGTLFLGLEGGGSNAISRISRFTGTGAPLITAIGSNALLTGQTIEFLSLMTQEGQTSPNLSAVVKNTNNFEQTKVITLNNDGSKVSETATDLKDASGTNATAGIVRLAANEDRVFVAVRPNGGNLGDVNSGIALIEVDTDTLAQTIKDATTGADGNKAQKFDQTSAQIKINGNVSFVNIGTTTPTKNESIRLHWDEKLQRLYIGVNVQSGGNVGDGARSVALAKIEANGTLTILDFVPSAAFDNQLTDIIGAAREDIYIYTRRIKIMHASTGPSYLITNGFVSDLQNDPVNSIYALPIVDNSSNADHGTLARKDSALTNGKFTIPATTNAHLLDTSNATDLAAAWVGGSELPMPDGNLPSDIVVVGDTVYASIEEEQSDDSESGIFYSQALFDQNGKIIRWTPWTKRAFPFDGFPIGVTEDQHKGKVRFFDVDAANGKIWAVDGNTKTNLASTSWGLGNRTSPNTLTYKLNQTLGNGCFCALDLDQSTRGLGTETAARYALFGGVNKVVFAKVTESKETTSPFNTSSDTIPASQTVITDFSDAENFLETALPTGAGAVMTLEYSRRLSASDDQNYFFAGTQNGLYVFAAANGAGFTIADTVNNLNAAPFNGQWHKMNGIEGSVIAIKTTGRGNDNPGNGALYVLTVQASTSAERPLIFKLYNIPFHVSITNMEGAIALIAESEVTATNSDLSNIKAILGMEVISRIVGGNTAEQLVIATNQGLYRSTISEAGASPGVINATTQAAALWQQVSATDLSMYYNIFGIDNAVQPTTVWPLQIADEKGLQTFERGTIRQLNGTAVANPYSFVPTQFNSLNADPDFQTIDATTFFWSDGARRFFIISRPNDCGCRNRLMVLPYDATQWNLNSPNQYLADPTLGNICLFHWVKQIGATGILMAGTNTGIVALE